MTQPQPQPTSPTPLLCAERAAAALQLLSDDSSATHEHFVDQIALAAAWRDLGRDLCQYPPMCSPPPDDAPYRR